jgi:hypothetical protein
MTCRLDRGAAVGVIAKVEQLVYVSVSVFSSSSE